MCGQHMSFNPGWNCRCKLEAIQSSHFSVSTDSIPTITYSIIIHMKIRNPIWGDDLSHDLEKFYCYGFSGFSSVVMCQEIYGQSPVSTHCHCIQQIWHWLRRHTSIIFFFFFLWLQPMAPWTSDFKSLGVLF